MSKEPAPRLGGGLIVRKGEAAPTTAPVAAAADVMPAPLAVAPAKVTPRGVAGTIAVTVRLDPERYERLKMHGAKNRQTNQEILVAALDGFLSSKVAAGEAG